MWFIICALILYKLHELAHWGRDKWTPFRRRHFQVHFWNENVWIPINISLKFVLKGPINNITAFVQVMACRWPGDKPLSEPMVVRLPKHICATRPQWVKGAQLSSDPHYKKYKNCSRRIFDPQRDYLSSTQLYFAILINTTQCRALSQYKDRLIYVWWFPC